MNARPLHLLLIPVLGVLCASISGQTTTSPDNTSAQAAQAVQSTTEGRPSPTPTPSPTAGIEPPSLIPPNILPAPSNNALPQIPNAPDLQLLNSLFKQTSLGKAADEHRLHVQMAALEVQVRNDEDLHEIKQAARRVPTDLERRHLLKHYYEVYYGKLRARAATPELKDYIGAQQAAHELVLLQPKTRHQTDEDEATALAAKATAGSAQAALPHPTQAKVNDILPRD